MEIIYENIKKVNSKFCEKPINLVALKIFICYNFYMKILVVSDTHGSVGPILTAIDREKPDVLIHLGDGINDLRNLNFSGQIYAVRGNNDLNGKLKSMAKVSYGKTIILYMHGHEYDVSQGYAKLVNFATQQGADIVLFGHTHKPDYFERNGIIFANPGAMKDRATATYLTIDLQTDKAPVITHHKLMED